jgi:hypothetical protein
VSYPPFDVRRVQTTIDGTPYDPGDPTQEIEGPAIEIARGATREVVLEPQLEGALPDDLTLVADEGVTLTNVRREGNRFTASITVARASESMVRLHWARSSAPTQWMGPVRVLATDLDTNCVAHAKRGVYAADRLKDLPRATLERCFEAEPGRTAYRVRPEVAGLVTFGRLNLMDAWPIRGPLDVIFCRNVVIYFDKDAQRRLFDRMADLQPEGGHLFLGHSETLFKVSTRYELIGRTVYRRAGP